ncbi:MAG: transcription-repair coupling factor [Clostridia bacterium]|nr:transcription-repair coupling factor [Clostridia bacterium]
MNIITQELTKLSKFQEYVEKIEEKISPITISGLSDVGKVQFIAGTYESTKKPICIVTYNEMQAKNIIKNLSFFESDIQYFPKREIVPYDFIAESKDLPYERINVLNKLNKGKCKIIITTIEAVMQKMISKKELYKNIVKLKVGDTYNLENLKEKLIFLGYERNDLVETKSQFSIRGGIVDIAVTEKKGIRIEFWGDDVDSIREFNISSQRSEVMLEEANIYPAHELLLEAPLEEIQKRILENSENFNDKEYENKVNQIKNEDAELIKSGDYLSKVDKYFNDFYYSQNTFLDYLKDEFLIIFDEYSKIKQRKENIIIENNNLIKSLIEKGRFVPQAIQNISNYNYDLEESKIVYLEKQDTNLSKISPTKYAFDYRDVNYYKSEIELLFDDMKKNIKDKKIIVLAGNEEETNRFGALLTQQDIPNKVLTVSMQMGVKGTVPNASTEQDKALAENMKIGANGRKHLQFDTIENRVLVMQGRLTGGFKSYDQKLIVISGEELFASNSKKRRKPSKVFKQGEKVVFSDLKVGDYVVHKAHGIGQFIGVNTIKTQGVTKDYIKIRYKNDDMLYIPTNDLDSIRKYIGEGEAIPKINKLGSKEWENTKAKVKKNLQEIAKELIELYAKRQKVKGFAFSKDTPWQKEFEDSFPYSETDDQLRCIEETKKDMEADKPMDRLLCGDVGYGKTEVAIRAAFKAVIDQKQVAYLVPTTVLANQQYETFKSRMENFAIKVELLNRFRTKKQQDEVIRKLKLGEIDVVIGTHRLLSKDVEFKDLGLLIIDEEHRFGVKDKEKIKQYKTSVDVLTMTATPIPRTLHMSIVGVRDMSVIYEPPQNRRPVQTYVTEYDEEIIKEAITKELERNGQIFYLYNNVEGIEEKSMKLQSLIPEAKVSFAHGKMSGKELEEIMLDFINGETNVLVCTTILESGIDIPNANTIIVENADKLGLAQLYQIRGRVGRSDKQAYAYVTYKRDKLLSEVADKRLKAIKEFTEFGSGFKIAMRDLEIRGAGSMLRRNASRTYGASRI